MLTFVIGVSLSSFGQGCEALPYNGDYHTHVFNSSDMSGWSVNETPNDPNDEDSISIYADAHTVRFNVGTSISGFEPGGSVATKRCFDITPNTIELTFNIDFRVKNYNHTDDNIHFIVKINGDNVIQLDKSDLDIYSGTGDWTYKYEGLINISAENFINNTEDDIEVQIICDGDEELTTLRFYKFEISSEEDQTSGIEDNDLSESIEVYSYNKSIFLSSDEYMNTDVVIYNMSGQTVKNETLNLTSGRTEINLNDFESGIYLVNVSDGVSVMRKKVFIK